MVALPPRNIRPQSHSASGRIMSIKTSSDIIGNRNHDLPACSAVPQSTGSQRGRYIYLGEIMSQIIFLKWDFFRCLFQELDFSRKHLFKVSGFPDGKFSENMNCYFPRRISCTKSITHNVSGQDRCFLYSIRIEAFVKEVQLPTFLAGGFYTILYCTTVLEATKVGHRYSRETKIDGPTNKMNLQLNVYLRFEYSPHDNQVFQKF